MFTKALSDSDFFYFFFLASIISCLFSNRTCKGRIIKYIYLDCTNLDDSGVCHCADIAKISFIIGNLLENSSHDLA